jgi:hypothetical protein
LNVKVYVLGCQVWFQVILGLFFLFNTSLCCKILYSMFVPLILQDLVEIYSLVSGFLHLFFVFSTRLKKKNFFWSLFFIFYALVFFWALDFKLGSQTHIVRLSPIGLRVHTKSFRKENLHFYVSKKCLSNVALRKKTYYTDFLSFISFPFLVFTKHDPCFFN